jgi:hypothetical protein
MQYLRAVGLVVLGRKPRARPAFGDVCRQARHFAQDGAQSNLQQGQNGNHLIKLPQSGLACLSIAFLPLPSHAGCDLAGAST